MRFFGVSSAVKAAAYVILSGREAAWEDILSGDWLPDLRAQLHRKILGRDLDGEAAVDARQAAALECIDELLSVTDGASPDDHRDLPHLRQLVADVDRLLLPEAWEWCARHRPRHTSHRPRHRAARL